MDQLEIFIFVLLRVLEILTLIAINYFALVVDGALQQWGLFVTAGISASGSDGGRGALATGHGAT